MAMAMAGKRNAGAGRMLAVAAGAAAAMAAIFAKFASPEVCIHGCELFDLLNWELPSFVPYGYRYLGPDDGGFSDFALI